MNIAYVGNARRLLRALSLTKVKRSSQRRLQESWERRLIYDLREGLSLTADDSEGSWLEGCSGETRQLVLAFSWPLKEGKGEEESAEGVAGGG